MTQKINVDTIDWLCRTFDGRIIFPSTCSVYGANDEMVDENGATEPLSLYAEGKLEAESVIMSRRPDSLIFRLATMAGVGDSYSRIRMDLVVNLLVMRAKLVGHLQVFGGQQYRPMLHVRDVATAMVPADRRQMPSGSSIWVPRTTPSPAIAERIVERVGAGEIEHVDVPFQDTRNYQVSFERAETGPRVQARVLGGRRHRPGGLAHRRRTGQGPEPRRVLQLHALRPYLCPEEIPLGREIRRPHSLSRHAGHR